MKYFFLLTLLFTLPFENVAQELGQFTDSRDGKKYKTVKIGKQTWMAENLNATFYSDGTAIPLVTDSAIWFFNNDSINYSFKAYCYYNNDKNDESSIYGALYNWNAASNGIEDGRNIKFLQGICPTGWHLPSDEEWKQLELYLGMDSSFVNGKGTRNSLVGQKLKSKNGWIKNGNGTNSSGFNALSSGYRSGDGEYTGFGKVASFWTSTSERKGAIWVRTLDRWNKKINRSIWGCIHACSVRCIKN